MNSIRRHLSYANVVATMALVLAMGGTAVAAKHYLINSTSQIKPSVLKKLKGNAGATGAAGVAGAAGTQGKEGPQGKEGSKGLQGIEGPSGISGYQVVKGPVATNEGGTFNFARSNAKCPSGLKALGGGFLTISGENGKIYVADDGPNGSGEWEIITASASATGYTMAAFAICANVTS